MENEAWFRSGDDGDGGSVVGGDVQAEGVGGMNLGRRTQILVHNRDLRFFKCCGIWPDPPVMVDGKPWQLFRYWRLGFLEVRRWLEDFPKKGKG